jgi:hypothetical protein
VKKKILTHAQITLAQKLGIPLEVYAKEVQRMNDANKKRNRRVHAVRGLRRRKQTVPQVLG